MECGLEEEYGAKDQSHGILVAFITKVITKVITKRGTINIYTLTFASKHSFSSPAQVSAKPSQSMFTPNVSRIDSLIAVV